MSEPNLDGPVLAPASDQRREPRAGRLSATPRSLSSTNGRGPSLAYAVVLAVTIVGAAVGLYLQGQKLSQAQNDLVGATDRIKRLEEELNVTGSTVSEEGQKAKEKFKFWEQETGKLWELAKSTRNRANESAKDIDSLQKVLKQASGNIDGLQASVARVEKGLAATQALAAQVNDLTASLQESTRAQRELTDKVNAADQSSRALKASLEKRVQEQEEAIAAFDSFRRQLNTRLNTMSSDIAALKNPPKD